MTGWPDSALHVGISGWRYPPWRGAWYPTGLAQRRELAWAARRLGSIELNGSFYALQRPSSYEQWYADTPDGFVFAVKGPRFVTHLKKLAGVEVPLANFFASGVLGLREKLGPLLWQLPPTLGFDADRLAAFFDLLPRSTASAADRATRHDERMAGRSMLVTDADRPLRHAIEVRHSSYRTTEFIELLRSYDIALVCADTAGKWPMLDDVTADVVYVRLHGAEELYVSGYDDPALDRWADRLRTWRDGATPTDGSTLAAPAPVRARDVFCYFDNDTKVRAPQDAEGLARRLGIEPPG